MKIPSLILLALMPFFLFQHSAFAQKWELFGKGIDSEVNSFCEYQGVLFVGGRFSSAGEVPVSLIACWNGAKWDSVGRGMEGDGVYTLCEYKGELYAGGDFYAAGGKKIYGLSRWNGKDWLPVGGNFNKRVNALAVFKGELYAGGEFDSIGKKAFAHIARWNGSDWNSVDKGFTSPTGDNSVTSLLSDNGKLYVGGRFTKAGGMMVNHIAAWDGNKWLALGNGFDGTVFCLAAYQKGICAGGDFSSSGDKSMVSVAYWNGAVWDSLGSGLSGYVFGLQVVQGTLYTAGSFRSSGSREVKCFAAWNNKMWTELGGGLSGLRGEAMTLGTYKGSLAVGGIFSQAGNLDANHIVLWKPKK
ncbi:MAG: hypothetical protein ACHQRM_14715 [Bacteroidia bacterium]